MDERDKGGVEATKEVLSFAGGQESLMDEEGEGVGEGGLVRVFSWNRFGSKLTPEFIGDPVQTRESATRKGGDGGGDVLNGEDTFRGESLGGLRRKVTVV